MKFNLYPKLTKIAHLALFFAMASNISFAHDVPEPSINSGLIIIDDKAFDSLSGANLSIDNNDFSAIFSLTYPVSPSVAFEVAALTGSEASAKISKSKSGTLHKKSYSTNGALTLKAKRDTSYLAGMKFSTSNNESLNFYARTGLIFWEIDFSTSGTSTLTYNGSTYNSKSFLKVDGSDPYLGFGLSYKASDNSSLGLDYYTLASTNAIEGAKFDINGYSLSWSFNF